MAINKKDIGKSGGIRYENTSSDQITITEDKLRLKLKDFYDAAKNNQTWMSWLGIFITTACTLGSTNFHETLGIPSVVLETICWIVCIISLATTIYYIYKSYHTDTSIDGFINKCKNVE